MHIIHESSLEHQKLYDYALGINREGQRFFTSIKFRNNKFGKFDKLVL